MAGNGGGDAAGASISTVESRFTFPDQVLHLILLIFIIRNAFNVVAFLF